MNKKVLIVFLMVFISLIFHSFNKGFTQSNDSCLSAPMDIPLIMSSSFCEPRSGHFHAGVDYKTQGKEGIPLRSIKDGELYRIKINPFGYGRALYIKHPDSTLSVYAHMQSFRKDIQAFAENLQYEKQSFFIDTVFEKAPFVFHCGENIGLSGNSGYSFGPHLHFEIRKHPTEESLNAQNFFPVEDNIPPHFSSIVFYDLDQAYLPENKRAKRYNAKVSGKNYSLGDISLKTGKWGIGTEIKDRMNNTHNTYGIVDLQVFVNDEKVYHSRFNEYDWNESDLDELFIDEYFLRASKKYILRCFVEGVNHSGFIRSLPKNGVVELSEGEIKKIRLIAIDAAGNTSECNFRMIGEGEKPMDTSEIVYPYNQSAFIPGEGFYLELPENSLYRDASVKVTALKNKNNEIYSWKFSDEWFVFYKPFRLMLDASFIPQKYRDKTILMRERNKKKTQVESTWDSSFCTVETRFPGRFYFEIDSIPPTLQGGFKDSVNLVKHHKIAYKSEDKLSGLKSYNAWVDNQWVLLQYDPKTNILKYVFDDKTTKNQWHQWHIQVIDNVGNINEHKFTFFY